MSRIRPPAHIAPIVEIFGQDDAVEFLLEHGGGYLYFSDNPTARNPVAKRFGRDKAVALGRVYGRRNMRVPLAKDWVMRVLASRGVGTHEIAKRLHVSDVTVRRAIGTRDRLQLDMFENTQD